MNETTAKYLAANYRVVKGNLVTAAGKRSVTPVKVLTAMLTNGIPLVQPEELDEWIKQQDAAQPERGPDQYVSESDYICAKVIEYGMTVAESGVLSVPVSETNPNRAWVSLPNIVGRMKLDLAEYNRKIPIGPDDKPISPKLQPDLIQIALDIYLDSIIKNRLDSVMADLEYRPGAMDLEAWVKCLLETYGISPVAKNIAMFCHLLYLIKRRVFNKIDNERPLFFVFFSRRQGTGKTTLISKLATPFPWAYSPDGVLGNLTSANDYKAMVRNKYIIDFQELAISSSIKGERGEVDPGVIAKIKQAITTGVIGGRAMYGTGNTVEAQSAIFTSSSNVHIYDVIQDPGGMRRFWEFRMEPRQDVDFATANEILADVADAYRAIDENDPRGFYYPGCPCWDEMQSTQEGYAKADSFSQFLRSKGWDVCPDEGSGYEATTCSKLRTDFNHWLSLRGDREWSMSAMLRLLAQKDIIPQRIKAPNGKIDDVLYLNKNFDWSLK